jgi:RimJ/RimL family protein N-acetyltransferase
MRFVTTRALQRSPTGTCFRAVEKPVLRPRRTSFEFVTERLRIRPWRADDRPTLARMVCDPDMMRYITLGRTWSERSAAVWKCSVPAHRVWVLGLPEPYVIPARCTSKRTIKTPYTCPSTDPLQH